MQPCVNRFKPPLDEFGFAHVGLEPGVFEKQPAHVVPVRGPLDEKPVSRLVEGVFQRADVRNRTVGRHADILGQKRQRGQLLQVFGRDGAADALPGQAFNRHDAGPPEVDAGLADEVRQVRSSVVVKSV